MSFLYEIDADYGEYCDEYAASHPVRELGMIVGYRYPNGSIRYVDDYDEEEDDDEGYLNE